MTENNTTNKFLKKTREERRFSFIEFENKWMKKIFWVLFLSFSAFVAAISSGAVSINKINTIEKAMAGKVDVAEHNQKHENVDLRMAHVEQAVIEVQASATRMEIYGAQQQDERTAELREVKNIIKAFAEQANVTIGSHSQ